MQFFSYTLIISIFFNTLFSNICEARSNLYIFSEIQSVETGDRALDLYQCILAKTNFQPEILTEQEKRYPRLDLIETRKSLVMKLHVDQGEQYLLHRGKKTNFVTIGCRKAKELSFKDKNKGLQQLAPNWSLDKGPSLITDTSTQPSFFKKNWPWLLGGAAVAVAAAVLIAKKPSPPPRGLPKTVIQGVNIR